MGGAKKVINDNADDWYGIQLKRIDTDNQLPERSSINTVTISSDYSTFQYK